MRTRKRGRIMRYLTRQEADEIVGGTKEEPITQADWLDYINVEYEVL